MTNTELGYMEVHDKPTPLATTLFTTPGHTLKQSGRPNKELKNI